MDSKNIEKELRDLLIKRGVSLDSKEAKKIVLMYKTLKGIK